MINSSQMINGLWMGIVLIVIDAMSGFAVVLTYRFPQPTAPLKMKQPRWLAVAGAAMIAFSFLLYFAK